MTSKILIVGLLLVPLALLSLGGCSGDHNVLGTSDNTNSGSGGTTGGGGGGSNNGGGSGGGGDTGGSQPVYQYIDITPGSAINLFPVLTNGDREFDGHGPDIWISARLVVSADKKYLDMIVEMTARETVADWSTAYKSWRWRAYTAPTGWVIESPNTFSASSYYRDVNKNWDYPPISGSLIKFLSVLGDTSGPDIGVTADDCHIGTISFNKVTYKLRKL
jgi:hypothetical protein